MARDGTAEPVSRDQILRREQRRQGNIMYFPCSADHVQDWQPYPVDPHSFYMCDHRSYCIVLHTVLYFCFCRCCCFIPFILDVRLHLWWTHQPGSHRPRSFFSFFFPDLPCAVLALIFYREKDSAIPFPRRP